MDTGRIYIDGEWVASKGADTIDVIDATHETVLAQVPAGDPADVDLAVAAAARAFPDWAATPLEQRVAMTVALGEAVGERVEEIATTITREVGMPLPLSRITQAQLAMLDLTAAAPASAEVEWERKVGNSVVYREPVGVVGAITPWNYPLHQITAKLAAALVAGCTIVIKPSEVAPLSAWILMELVDQVGLPAGVVNLVSGPGPTVGEALASHADVDMVSFTGSTRAGARVAQLATARVARIALELGGKSPNVLLEDAPFETAVPDGVSRCYLNSGQTCSALTRLIVPRARLDEVEQLAVAAAETFVLGDPLVEGTRLGPLASQLQWERVQAHIRGGVDEGARLLTGGPGRPEGLDVGYFARPTVFSDVTTSMRIAQEEVFGPVLVIQPYDSEEEAVVIANSSEYGLSGGVWSADVDRAVAVARRLRTGQVTVNGGRHNPLAPFGGYRRSGIGREYGSFGIEEMTELKALQL